MGHSLQWLPVAVATAYPCHNLFFRKYRVAQLQNLGLRRPTAKEKSKLILIMYQ